jgi:hypothetical protein
MGYAVLAAELLKIGAVGVHCKYNIAMISRRDSILVSSSFSTILVHDVVSSSLICKTFERIPEVLL